MGYPNLTRGPGFLGPEAGFLYLTSTKAGPSGLRLPPDVDRSRQTRRESLLVELQRGFLTKSAEIKKSKPTQELPRKVSD